MDEDAPRAPVVFVTASCPLCNGTGEGADITECPGCLDIYGIDEIDAGPLKALCDEYGLHWRINE